MKFVIIFAALFAVALAYPNDAIITRQDSDVQPEGYDFIFETSDGTKHESQGHLENVGSDHESLNVKGFYSYIGDDGQEYRVDYTAGEQGFVPTGAHLPQPQ